MRLKTLHVSLIPEARLGHVAPDVVYSSRSSGFGPSRVWVDRNHTSHPRPGHVTYCRCRLLVEIIGFRYGVIRNSMVRYTRGLVVFVIYHVLNPVSKQQKLLPRTHKISVCSDTNIVDVCVVVVTNSIVVGYYRYSSSDQ